MSYSRSILITGGTSGLGAAAALELAAQHPTTLIVIASRTDSSSVAQTINSTLRQSNVIFLAVDLFSASSIRSFAKSWSTTPLPPIHSLLLNAGLQFPSEIKFTAEGIEKTFAINHLGNAQLFLLLRPNLAPNARIVITLSGTHDPAQKTGVPEPVYKSAQEVAYPDEQSAKAPGRQRYSTSKLCNMLFTYALARRLEKEGQGRTVVAFDPGLMPETGLVREAGAPLRFLAHVLVPRAMGLLRAVVGPNVHTPKESAVAMAVVAVPKEGEKAMNGIYYEGTKEIKSSKDSYDTSKQEDLWEWTVKQASANEEERKKFDSF